MSAPAMPDDGRRRDTTRLEAGEPAATRARKVLADLERISASIQRERGMLRVSHACEDVITPHLVDRIREAKPELLGLVSTAETPCADCAVDVHAIGEWYMVKDKIWDRASRAHRKWRWDPIPPPNILCIGCLGSRLRRGLQSTDFLDCLLNDVIVRPDKSGRLRDRLGEWRPQSSRKWRRLMQVQEIVRG